MKLSPLVPWLFASGFMILAMIVVGAITRLTDSGLSMVEWRPLMGALPPLSEAEWDRVYDLYRQSPEFRGKHSWMELEDFKRIFFWEWFHRLLGRVTGLVYAVPLVWFLIRKQIPAGYHWPLIGLFFLGGAQGLMGWIMVQSGLVDRPSVSHYRLAAHLGLALLLLSLLFWTALSLIEREKKSVPVSLYIQGWATFALACVTVLWGAFVAGLDAGLVYNTFPTMDGHWIPPEMFALPILQAVFEDHGGVQFTHRCLALLTGVAILAFWFRRKDLKFLPIVVFVQISLGIATLIFNVPLVLAVTHQVCAVVLLLSLLFALHGMQKQS